MSGALPAAADPSGSLPATVASSTQSGQAQEFIVGYRPGSQAASSNTAAVDKATTAGKRIGHDLAVVRRLATNAVLLRADASLDGAAAGKLMADLRSQADVAYVEPNQRIYPTATVNDTRFGEQWDYTEAAAGMNVPGAWDIATGTGVTVAVIDTGITPHSDLSANVIAGYDFVSNATDARDGNGRDANPNDEGDWTSVTNECGNNNPPLPSSWHGTHVAGTIAAVANNSKGVAGVAFNAKVQPLRALGHCGGTLADIADAIVWASGGTVSGVPANATPAQVINMSLGGDGTCATTYQNAINSAVSRGTTVVVAAGNDASNAALSQPASCNNVITVAAVDRQGNRADYSNFGAIVDLSAPGGETAVAANGILSTLNAGTTTQGSEAYAFYQGTSMATPHVAGLAALMLSKKSLTPAQVESSLKANTRPLPGTCPGGCGVGMADATKTLQALATAPNPSGVAFENTSNVNIPDAGAAVESAVTVTGVTGNAPSALPVAVDIKHPFRGDLVVDLVAPDGTTYRLKNSSSTDSADNVTGTFTVNASSETANGTWRLRVQDIGASDTGFIDSWNLTFPAPAGVAFENTSNVNIPDAGAAVESAVTVTGVTGNAPSALPVAVDIKHPFRGDLVVDLVAPDGTTYRLKNSSSTDSADNVTGTFTVNASSETANGTWRLRVQDIGASDTGFIDSWNLTF
ncbi:S8 family serine peptidase [Streptomyces sp. NBC_00233]|uniref:S8 family peptidase n=1 Tax=Streptomyces sp. NBC_00233 TaxID=2975686 RepID=UPI00225508A5|nr:S8 family serine peptidase [Streptomyces sp. NBC_00233]MCX5233383.1 S8 family serine peptidase [Streptomyces sp. NBC_00233]